MSVLTTCGTTLQDNAEKDGNQQRNLVWRTVKPLRPNVQVIHHLRISSKHMKTEVGILKLMESVIFLLMLQMLLLELSYRIMQISVLNIKDI